MFVDEITYNLLVKLMDKLVDEVGENESHPQASLMVEKLEKENI